MRRRRTVRTLLAAAVLGLSSTALAAGPAQAAGEPTLTADPLSTWQTDGIVWTLAHARGVVYVGGTFEHIRPPGAAPGTGELPRRNFAAFDAVTGEPLPCAPEFTGGAETVRAMKASPDGSLLYIGGSFGSAGGVGRSNTAALDTADCTVAADWKPVVSSTVRAIDVTDTAVYIGGQFTTVQGQTRERVAALAPDSTLLPFNVTVRGSSISNDPTPGINAITVAPHLNKVVIGGRFTSINGSLLNSVHGLVGLDATTGRITDRFTGWIPRRSAVKSLVNDGTNFYLGAEGTGGGVFDGRAAGRLSDGALLWKDTCLGATQAVVPYQGVLYSASHAHNCDQTPGGFPEHNNRQHLLAQSISDETILPWFPDTNDGIGEQIGPRAMVMADGILWTGGEFTTVNEKPQQGLTRFAAAPDTGAPQVPLMSGATGATGKIELSWKASWDRDDGVLTYRIYRDGVFLTSIDQDSRYWDRPMMGYTDTVEPGATHRYSLEVTDGTNLSGRNGPVYVTAGN
ncbi:fibronectin type III domain-containing protein [Streptomyces sp. DH37]|uniref:fibronectin type III domain-containing protein n=1 Tax=Streptomyces sp. DH37 TaxID=3040122 RepID=UPI0024435DCF|nr:fibronectin type III domain-containing protein [Streptomyces sp. DH37]MDG9704018.1 fibronectin type III domain-containing protein [Streptomyces sp. DH37]